MKPTLIIFPCPTKKCKKRGLIPIYFRVIHQRKKSEGKILIDGISNIEYRKWDPRTFRFIDKTIEANKEITRIEGIFNEWAIDNRKKYSEFTAVNIRDFLLERNPLQETKTLAVLEYIENYYTKTILPNSNLEKGTKKNYKKAFNHFKKYLAVIDKEKISIVDFNHKLAISFLEYLMNNRGEKKGMSHASATSNIKKLITVFERALNEELIRTNPFKNLKLTNKCGTRAKLSIHQINQIQNMDISYSAVFEIYRDIFMFSVFTGLAHCDIFNLSMKDIQVMKDDNLKISKQRHKTDILTEVCLVKPAINLIQKYENSIDRQLYGLVFPKRSNQKMNQHLKLIAAKCMLNINLSTHIARHSFSQLLTESGIEDSLILDKMMGHSSEGYIGSKYRFVSEDMLINAKNKFENYLSTYLK
jgi:site-specific recombinase XerD